MSARKWFKKYHKWPALVMTLFIILFSVSGIILNHRGFFAGTDVNRKLLPEVYRYNNWNLSGLKSAVKIGEDSVLYYGNIGIWLSDSAATRFTDFNQGFPDGIDQRKIFSVCKTTDGKLYAGTLFGLYTWEKQQGWVKQMLPVKEERINRVFQSGQAVCVLTRSHLLRDQGKGFQVVSLPPAEDEKGIVSLFRTLWVIHSGEIYGFAGKLFVDFIGFVFVFLSFSGLIYFISPSLLRRMKNELRRSRWKRFNCWSLKWHNRGGSWLIPLLILTTLTGMFLRPPLLIPIAGVQVPGIPFSMLRSPNPWEDELREILYDTAGNRIILYSSDGMYFTDTAFTRPFQRFACQPPVSVMGLNHFQALDSASFLVGSFSGLFRWTPEQHRIEDFLTGKPYTEEGRGPVGDIAVTACFQPADGQWVVVDFMKGAFTAMDADVPRLNVFKMPEMPEEIIQKSPMSLWNVALEFHTCRIYQPAIGNLYIILIPLFGLAILFVLITGFFSWYLGQKKS
jgi:hypothetical protein